MTLKIGQYVHTVHKYLLDDEGLPRRVTGRVIKVESNGDVYLTGGSIVNTNDVNIIVFNEPEGTTISDNNARIEAMKRHPAGKGRL